MSADINAQPAAKRTPGTAVDGGAAQLMESIDGFSDIPQGGGSDDNRVSGGEGVGDSAESTVIRSLIEWWCHEAASWAGLGEMAGAGVRLSDG